MKVVRSTVGLDESLWPSVRGTERHAYDQAIRFLPEVPKTSYFGFPWAALIDGLDPCAGALLQCLEEARPLLAGQTHVVTVCQHERLPENQQLFADAGITHIFWSHAQAGQACLAAFPDIALLPFPLLPGSDDLPPDSRESLFAPCPSSPGGNSARLWAAVRDGLIPVFSAEDVYLPGGQALWEEAAVFPRGTPEALQSLPDHLEVLARDEELLARKQQALRQLWLLYGTDCFIYDVQKLFLTLSADECDAGSDRKLPACSYGRLFGMAAEINRNSWKDRELPDTFILGCTTRILADPAGFLARYRDDEGLRAAYRAAASACNEDYRETLSRLIEHKHIVLE